MCEANKHAWEPNYDLFTPEIVQFVYRRSTENGKRPKTEPAVFCKISTKTELSLCK